MTHNKDETDLEAFFDAARRTAPRLPDALRDRIVADARSAMPASRARRPGARWALFPDVVGGWFGLGGVVTAGLVGVWIGLAPPSDAMDPLALFDAEVPFDFFSDTLDLIEGVDDDA